MMRILPRAAAALLVCSFAPALGQDNLNEHAPKPDFTAAQKVLEQAIEGKAFPGCAFAVGNASEVLWTGGLGRFAYDDQAAQELNLDGNPRPTEKTVYDLASLTKVVGTTSLIMMLAAENKLSLDDPVERWIPQFTEGEDRDRRAQVTIEHLLVHASGLPAWKAFYRDAHDYDALLAAVRSTPLESAPGSQYRYSDLGFLLLGDIASKAGQAPQRELEQSKIFAPLRMTRTSRQVTAAARKQVPPTELDSETGQFVHAVVHDENSRAANGQTGHAGLFSTAEDLARFATEYLQALARRGTVFEQSWAEQFTRRRNLIEGSSRALGWDTPSGRSSGGQNISKNAFGHTGFTGTSMWIDPQRGIYLILLTNRVHPTRDNRQISRVRRELADAIWDAIDRTAP